MGAQDNTEKVLRSLHVLLSKSEPYPKEPSKVIIDKQQVIDLLAELNTCIYQIMDEYELTIRSRDKAERDFHKKGDQIIWDASRKAEDIYAASVMYMDETLNRMQDIMQEADKKVGAIYQEIKEQMEKEEQELRTNKSELKGQLQDLVDTEKYLKIIEERNREIEKEKMEGRPEYEQEKREEKAIYANRQTAEQWKNLIPKQLWYDTVEEAQDLMDADIQVDIQGYDIDAEVVKAARENAKRAGVDHLIHFQQRAVADLHHPKKYGFVITNPPYGERLEEKEDLPELYTQIGQAYAGLDSWSLYMITSYEDAERYIGRKADKNRKIYNGMIKTYFYQFMGPKPTKRREAAEKTIERKEQQ